MPLTPTSLCPAQQPIFDVLLEALPVANIFVLSGYTGMGKTTVLRELHRMVGGAFLPIKQFVDAMRNKHPFQMEETFEQMLMEALDANDIVILDNLDLLSNVLMRGYGGYPRTGFLEAPLTALADFTEAQGKKLILGGDECSSGAILRRCYHWSLREFQCEDYTFLCRHYLGQEKAEALDFAKIYRFAPELNAHQLKGACIWLRRLPGLDTERFIEYLRSNHMSSNVDLDEVQVVNLHDLKGVDDVVESLETNIILPLENDELATRLQLKPKRGVLLAGPPGTGKTTVGRALAHRLKSKFFLVDGTFISGTDDFYSNVAHIFAQAQHNAPSIIFIDDSDVIFESGTESGLYRYLLTMLDGLESESAGRVCVMMTAMDVGNLPPALMRSGRVELWLETRLPDHAARTEILRLRFADLPDEIANIDFERLAEATNGLTGADLKRLVEDGKLLYASDVARQNSLRSPIDYFLSALETIQANKERYVAAEARARQRNPDRPPWFDAASL